MISGEGPKKEPQKARTTSFPIQLNTSKHRVNNSVYVIYEHKCISLRTIHIRLLLPVSRPHE